MGLENPDSITHLTVQQIRNGKIAAERIYFDQLDFLSQLGIAPAGRAG